MSISLSADERRLLDQLIDKLILMRDLRSPAIEHALRAVPRRLFLDRFYEGVGEERELICVDQDHPDLATLEKVYADKPLVTHYQDRLPASSTTQPVVVVGMLEDLALRPGLKVLEIGAGTGWNAALMATLVGDPSLIYSLDIQPDVAAEARVHLARAGFPGVHVLTADGGYGYPEAAPFDRIITTAGCPDVSPHWLDQLAEGGILLVLFKTMEWGDPVLRLVKRRGRVAGRFTRWCGFMKLRGDYSHDLLDPVIPDLEPALVQAIDHPLDSHPLPWAAAGEGKNWPVRSNFIFFLSLADPRTLQLYPRLAPEGEETVTFEGGCSLWDPETGSLCVLHRDRVGVYGHPGMYERLLEVYREWMSHYAPFLEDYAVSVYPIDQPVCRPRHGWLLRRKFAQYTFRVARR